MISLDNIQRASLELSYNMLEIAKNVEALAERGYLMSPSDVHFLDQYIFSLSNTVDSARRRIDNATKEAQK